MMNKIKLGEQTQKIKQ